MMIARGPARVTGAQGGITRSRHRRRGRTMNRANPTPSPRRALAAAAVIAALVGLAAMRAQGRSVSNDVLGVGLQHGADQSGACTADCTKTYNAQIKQENNLHRANEAAC